jgi:hypothetical protein
MGKRNNASSSKRIKTRHKNRNKKIKLITKPINPALRDINKKISQDCQQLPLPHNQTPSHISQNYLPI